MGVERATIFLKWLKAFDKQTKDVSRMLKLKKLVFLILFAVITLFAAYLKFASKAPNDTNAHGVLLIHNNQPNKLRDPEQNLQREVPETEEVIKPRQPVNEEPPADLVKRKPSVQRKDIIDNSGAKRYLEMYARAFDNTIDISKINPNRSEDITNWWQAAAMIEWFINSPLRYKCQKRETAGNWHICQDTPYTVTPPCLVYSFGINFDFSFDNAMISRGCEVHSFDPSMNVTKHKRGKNHTFYDIGLSNTNTDGFSARRDEYVRKPQLWKMRTLKSVMKELGHEGRVIDVLKIDIEGHEWFAVDNMIETGVFRYVRQFILEYHLFSDWPLKADYVSFYQTNTRLRELGFREYAVQPVITTLDFKRYRIQGNTEYVNFFFQDNRKKK